MILRSQAPPQATEDESGPLDDGLVSDSLVLATRVENVQALSVTEHDH